MHSGRAVMARSLPGLGVVLLIFFALPPAAFAASVDPGPVRSGHFEFHNDPWINLHHFLFQWARNGSNRAGNDHRRPVLVHETGDLADLSTGERSAWQRALRYYRAHLIGGRLLFDRHLIAIRNHLAANATGDNPADGLDPALRAILLDAMPVYRKHWWPAHHAANAAWIRERLIQLKTYESVLAPRLAEAYGGNWPAEPVRVDVVAYANWAGAYTTNHPDQITISSTDYQGLQALEILFHEVSHSTFFEQRLFRQLADAFGKYGTSPPNGLAHVIQFVTPAELLRTTLRGRAREIFRSVGEQVAAREHFRSLYAAVRRHWIPFLQGRTSRSEALEGVAADLVDRRKAEKHPGVRSGSG
jgi:hypothetical protein